MDDLNTKRNSASVNAIVTLCTVYCVKTHLNWKSLATSRELRLFTSFFLFSIEWWGENTFVDVDVAVCVHVWVHSSFVVLFTKMMRECWIFSYQKNSAFLPDSSHLTFFLSSITYTLSRTSQSSHSHTHISPRPKRPSPRLPSPVLNQSSYYFCLFFPQKFFFGSLQPGGNLFSSSIGPNL